MSVTLVRRPSVPGVLAIMLALVPTLAKLPVTLPLRDPATLPLRDPATLLAGDPGGEGRDKYGRAEGLAPAPAALAFTMAIGMRDL